MTLQPNCYLQSQVFACKSGVKMNGAWENAMILPKALVGVGKLGTCEDDWKVGASEGAGGASSYVIWSYELLKQEDR